MSGSGLSIPLKTHTCPGNSHFLSIPAHADRPFRTATPHSCCCLAGLPVRWVVVLKSNLQYVSMSDKHLRNFRTVPTDLLHFVLSGHHWGNTECGFCRPEKLSANRVSLWVRLVTPPWCTKFISTSYRWPFALMLSPWSYSFWKVQRNIFP